MPDPAPNGGVLPEVRIADATPRVDQDLYGGCLIAGEADPATAVRARRT